MLFRAIASQMFGWRRQSLEVISSSLPCKTTIPTLEKKPFITHRSICACHLLTVTGLCWLCLLHALIRYSYISARCSSASLFQAKQSQIPQYSLVWRKLQALYQLHGPSLDSLQYICMSLVTGSPEQDSECDLMRRGKELPFLTYSQHCWPSRLQGPAFQPWAPMLYWCKGIIPAWV